jgi:catechol 2,3-dioxygenase-like lactoylglutathione lyase family enzyme
MIDHTGLEMSDPVQSRRFYDQALAPIGYKVLMEIPVEFTGGAVVYGYGVPPKPDLWLHQGTPNHPRLHIAFRAENRAQVDAFYKAAMAAGGKDNGAPGLRPHYHKDYYGAFVLDPDGHNIEVVCHMPEPE